MKKATLRAGLAGSGLLMLVACNALIGTRDLTYEPTAGDGGGASDAPLGGDGSPSSDGSTCGGADLEADPHNCGRCGHDCLGGLCTAKTCQPAKLFASSSLSTFALAVDSTTVYFSDINAGGVYGFPKDAPVPATAQLLASAPDPLIYDIVADPMGVYFSWGSHASGDRGAIETVLPDGGGRRALLMDASVPRGLSISNSNVYFALKYLSPVQVGSVERSATNGTPTILSNDEPDTDNTFVSGNYVYWGGDSKGVVRFCSTNPGGCAATLKDFVTGLNVSEALGGNTKNLFISSFDILHQAAKGPNTTTTSNVAQAQPQVASIAADDRDLYWVNLGTSGNSFSDGGVRHCSIDANGAAQCAVPGGEIIATSDKNPRVIVMDDKAVYWTVQGEGAVYRLARP